jgi:hypothetical protein
LSLGAAAQRCPQEFAEFCQNHAHVASAFSLHYSASPELQHILQARLLTTETFAQIASRLSTNELVIQFYADLFFDVRDRLEARDWIAKVILGPPELRSKFNPDGTLTDAQRGVLYRLFAYRGGPLVLDSLIASIGSLNRPTQAGDVAEWMDGSLQEIIRTRAVMAVQLLEVNKTNAPRLIKLALPKKGKQRLSKTVKQQELDARMEGILAACERAMGDCGAAPAATSIAH